MEFVDNELYPLIGFEEQYNITTTGIIIRNSRWVERGKSGYVIASKVLNPTVNSVGYHVVNFRLFGVAYYFLVHRLVAEMFLGSRDGCNVINHIDHNKLNNHYKNLEWVNMRENYAHWARTQKQTSKYTGVHFYDGKWQARIRLGKVKNIGEFNTEIEAAQAYQQALIDNGIRNKYAIV